MAKTIMISNEVYTALKTRKNSKSYSELIKDLLTPSKLKKGEGLRVCLGSLKKDKELTIIDKSLRKGWKAWNKKYV